MIKQDSNKTYSVLYKLNEKTTQYVINSMVLNAKIDDINMANNIPRVHVWNLIKFPATSHHMWNSITDS